MTSAVPVGNTYDKFNTTNVVARQLMNGFIASFSGFFSAARAANVIEIGCGEGYMLEIMHDLNPSARYTGFDIDIPILQYARRRNPGAGVLLADAHRIPFADDAFDVAVCCEVLEHVGRPHDVIREIARITSGYVIVSVPREPIWRALNLVRGKYVSHMGNTPGHINHWSTESFVALLQTEFEVMAVRRPLPWSMVLCRVKASGEGTAGRHT